MVMKKNVMERLQRILKSISETNGCKLVKREKPINIEVGFILPDDLRFYFENYNSITFWEKSNYSMKIVGIEGFKKANPIIIGEDVPDDISNNWFIIAEDNPQFITNYCKFIYRTIRTIISKQRRLFLLVTRRL